MNRESNRNSERFRQYREGADHPEKQTDPAGSFLDMLNNVQIDEGNYFDKRIHDDMDAVVKDIREAPETETKARWTIRTMTPSPS